MKARVIKLHDAINSMRFDGSFHNASINVYDPVIREHSSHSLDYYCTNIFTSGRTKRVYTRPQFGYPFLSNTDVISSNPLQAPKYSSKKYGYDESALLRSGMILTGRVGAIGQTAFVSKNLERAKAMGSDNIIRIIVKPQCHEGYIYTYLVSKFGNLSLWKLATGGVQPFITDSMVAKLPIPDMSDSLEAEIDHLIRNAADLRDEASEMIKETKVILKRQANLSDLTEEDYDYYGPQSPKRKVSCYCINRRNIDTTTINAFNLSERIRKTKAKIKCPARPLKEILKDGDTFSTGSFPRVEVKEGHGVMLINQKDIFNSIIRGKYISKYGVKLDNLVEYGEVLIAGVGTLGENETFCRAIFANEDLAGQLVSGEFIRMKTTSDVPSGYLFAWLSTDYGFRFLRNIQAGTKLCRPIPRLVREIPVPILDYGIMKEIDSMIREAYTKRHKANVNELKAISLVEQEIEKWNKS